MGHTNSSAMQHQDETQAGRRYRSALDGFMAAGVQGRWQLCRLSFRYPVVGVRETGICQAPRVLGRLDLKGLTRNGCGWQSRSLPSTPMSSAVSAEYAEVFLRRERTCDQERLSLHRLSTPDSCSVTIAGSAPHGRDLGPGLWFMAPSRPVCPRTVAQRRGSWSAPARSACTGLGLPGAVRPLQARSNRSSPGCRTAMNRTLVSQCAA